jgi:hypothetical protein
MPLDTMTETQQEVVADAPGTTPPAPTTQVTAPQATTPEAQQGKTVVLPSSALGRIKKEERERGMRDAQLGLAKEAGFASVEEFQAFLKGRGQQATQPGGQSQSRPQQQPKPGNNGQQGKQQPRPQQTTDELTGRAKASWERERDKLRQEIDGLKKQSAHNDKRFRQTRKELEDRETEMHLRDQATQAGVRNVDYAVHLLRQHVGNKSEEELKGFDEGKFFDGLRGQHPYLFGETVRHPTTGTSGNGAAPPSPKPGDASAAAAKNGQVDAKKLSRAEYTELLRRRGLNPAI